MFLNSNILGYFLPSFFSMNVGDVPLTNGGLDLNSLGEHDFSVFFHEYVHYLQDMTTFHGMNKQYCVNQLFQESNRLIKEGVNPKFPINFDSFDSKVYLCLILQYATTYMKEGNISSCVIKSYENKDFLLGKTEKTMKVKIATLKVEDKLTNIESEVILSSTVIAESMAYLLQRMCTKIDYNSPDFPYTIAEKLTIGLCPDVFKEQPINTIALCDASLMSPNPGVIFLQAIDYIKRNKGLFTTPETIYDYVMTIEGTVAETTRITTVKDYFFDMVPQVRDTIKKYISIIGKNYEKDIVDCFNVAINFRKDNQYFFINLAREGYARKGKLFKDILELFGSPMIFDSKGNHSQIRSTQFENEFMSYFRGIYQMYRLYFHGKRDCELTTWCALSNNMNVNDLCGTNPLKRCDGSQLCPIGVLWKCWGMEGYNPIQ